MPKVFEVLWHCQRLQQRESLSFGASMGQKVVQACCAGLFEGGVF